jgi:hypothetical protein
MDKEKEIVKNYNAIKEKRGLEYAQRAINVWADDNTYQLSMEELERIIYGDGFVDVQENIRARKIKSITRNTLHDLGELNT